MNYRNEFKRSSNPSQENKTHLNQSSYLQELFLFSLKSQKEILLSLIKNVQENLLLEKNNETSFYKELLSDLKKNLLYMLSEKQTKEKYLQEKINNKKLKIQNIIFNSNKKMKNNNKKEERKINNETNILEKTNELSKLKMMNFKTENEIEKLNFLIKNRTYINNYLKATSIYPGEKSELFLDSPNKNSDEIEDSFNFQIHEVKDYLNDLAFEKNMQNAKIEQLQNNINMIKLKNQIENIIDKEDIIYEDSQENKKITDLENITNNFIVDKITENNNFKLKENKIEFISYDINNNKSMEMINKNLNNILNVNIHFNFKINKFISKMINSPKKFKINNCGKKKCI